VDVYLVDGTYELFRHYYALPSARGADGREAVATVAKPTINARNRMSRRSATKGNIANPCEMIRNPQNIQKTVKQRNSVTADGRREKRRMHATGLKSWLGSKGNAGPFSWRSTSGDAIREVQP
jgi:hypothetical protein